MASAGLELSQRRRGWVDIKPALVDAVLAGLSVYCSPFSGACAHMSLGEIVYILLMHC